MANLRYEGSTFDSSKCVSSLHQLVTEKLFDLQLALNDCTINELIFTLWSADLLHIPIRSPKITTTLLKTFISPDIVKKFGKDQPCEVIVIPDGDEAPKFTKHFDSYDFSEKNYWDLETKLAAKIKCVNATSESEDPLEYVQAITLLLDLETHFDLNITYSVKLGFQLYKLNLKYNGYRNHVVDAKKPIVINTELNAATPVIMGAVNAIFDKGRSFSNIFFDTPLCWLNLD